MKKFLIVLAVLVIGLVVIGNQYYQKIFGAQITQNTEVFISSSSSLDDVFQQLKPACKDVDALKWVAQLKKYSRVKGGKYNFKQGQSSSDVINKLRSGNQSPIKVRFNNQNYIEDLAGHLSKQVEADSLSLLTAFTDKAFLNKNGFNSKTALGLFMPYTYDFYWTVSPEKMREKFLKTYKNFWTKSRKAKAKQQGLSPNQAIALAAIVQKETSYVPERKTVAGLYLNRYKNGWPLQADPTVIYAVKEAKGRTTEIHRVLNKDLKTVSLYNTYLHKGIPPGPIAMPDVSSIEAVLNAEKHPYFYMCASTKKIGTHDFAKTLAQHNRNARIYQQWLSQRHINR